MSTGESSVTLPPLPPPSPQPTWHPYLLHNGPLLEVSLSYSNTLWPWSGYLAVSLSVASDGRGFTGEAQGHVTITVASSAVSGINELVEQSLNVN